jgi:hypothetical protein
VLLIEGIVEMDFLFIIIIVLMKIINLLKLFLL